MVFESPVTCFRFARITRSDSLFLREKYIWACNLSPHDIPYTCEKCAYLVIGNHTPCRVIHPWEITRYHLKHMLQK
jgi:hypothetical protein